MKWKAKITFRTYVACRVKRQAVDRNGVVTGETVATPFCPEGFLVWMYLADESGRSFQIGTDAIDLEVELPPNTGNGLHMVSQGEFFESEGPCRFVEDTLADRRWESEPFEVDGDFRPCDLCFRYWLVPSGDGKMRKFVDCDHVEYRHRPLKMNVSSEGYQALPVTEWIVKGQ